FTMKCLWDFHRLLLRGFYHYGYFLAKHPLWFLILPVVMCVVFAVGFVKYNPERDIETLYTPANSRAIQDRETGGEDIPDLSATILTRRSAPTGSWSRVWPYSEGFRQDVFSLRVVKDGQNFTYEDVCVRRLAGPNGVTMCATDTDIFLFDPRFSNALSAGRVTYPFWSFGTQGMDLSLYIADVEMSEDKTILKAAGSFKFSFPLRQDTPEVRERSLAWELEYAEYMKNKEFSTVEFSYAISQSLNLELDKGTKGDIFYFSLTFTLMITYASLVSAGGDCVSTRALLANAGVLAAGLGIMGAFGLVTICGVRFVNIVGVMPFLTLGIGVDDMFLLMGSWSEITAARGLSIPERIGHVFKKAGVGITITSLTDCLAFAVGSMSAFTSVKNFCIYTGVGVLLCYVCNATFFAACLTYHGRRVYSKRHTFTFKKVDKSRAELSNEGNTCCYAYLCGGAIPESPNDDQSVCEKAPKYFLTNFVLFKPVRLIIVILFVCYLGVSIWGCTKLRQGLELKDLVLDTSYFHKYQVWDTEDFGSKLPISFVTVKEKDYKDPTTLMNIIALLNEAKKDAYIDKNIHNCWLTEFYKEPSINTTDNDAFFDRLNEFLMRRPGFRNDIVFGSDKKSIIASRCQAYSVKVVESNEQANLMSRMRELADSSPADVFAYHPAFVYFEQYLSIVPGTFQTVGVTLAVMFVVTCFFIPQPVIVAIVMIQVIMIVVGIFGFMAHWGLTLSSITMIHLIMSVGFSVDFCAHVCTAYIVSEKLSREDRARDAIVHASGPIFNGGFSSILGVVVLYFTESYIFQSFFKIMVLVIGFGVLHAVFLIPVVLSFVGPYTQIDLEDDVPNTSSPKRTSDVVPMDFPTQKDKKASSTVVSFKDNSFVTNTSKKSNQSINPNNLPRETSKHVV
ncbi:hypothetical protein Btru_014364, partial [Bulinus truncatus]